MSGFGKAWRAQSDDRGWFDELAVRLGPKEVLHIERMDDRTFFVDLAGCVFTIWRDKSGRTHVRNFECRDGQVLLGPNDNPVPKKRGRK